MMTGIVPGKKKQRRWLWLLGALFLFATFLLLARNFTTESADTLTVDERAWLKAHPVIRLAPDPDFPPVEYLDGSGGYDGITADYVALIEKKLGIRFEIVRLRNWDEIISKAKSRQIDVYVATKTPQRAEYLLFTKPFLEFPVVIITREKVKTPLNLDKLQGMKVSAVSEYAAQNFIASYYPGLHLDPVSDVRTGLRKVSFGLSDAFVGNLATATYFIEKEGFTNLRITGESGYFYRMGFCSRKDWPELNRILDKGLAAISIDEKQAVYKKWIPVEPRSFLANKAVQASILSAFGVAVLIILGIVAWNRALTRQVSRRTEELEKELSERRRIEEELQHAREDLEIRVEERTAELRHAKTLLEEEISVRNCTERVITARLRLLEFATTHNMDELLQATLDEAEALTGSLIGFYHFLEADQKTLSLQNWSTRTKREYCKAEGKDLHYDASQAGVWVDCVHQRRPVIHNDYAALPHRKGLPPDHAPLIRELVVPVFRGENIVAIIAVGNKPRDYTSQDVEVVSLLADLAWEITERKQAEEALHLSRFCIDKAGIGIYQSDENGTIFTVNDHACRSLGYSREELCALSVFDIDPEITREKMLKLKEILDEKGSVTHETTHRRRDGTTFPVEITANLLDFRGKTYSISFVKDITERKRAEESLRHAKEEWERTFASVPDLIAILDNQHRILLVNEAMAKRLGLRPDECVGLHCYEAIHGLSEPPPFCPHTQTLRDGMKHLAEVQEERLGGDFLVSTTPLNDERGVMTGSVHIAYDITDRKRAEEALRESESRVRRKLESILDPEGDTGELELADILDTANIQVLMDDLYRITGLKMSIIDLKGRVLTDVGWQDICTKFHRKHPETLKKCLESDSDLTVGVPQGEFKTYRCKNNMWHLVTPIIVGGRHMGNLFMGQFFFENEELDYDLFRSQARKYGFPEEEYIAALEAVPRHSEELVTLGKAVFLRLTDMFSKLSYANIKLAHSLAERDRLTATLRQANMVVENSPVVLFRWKGDDEWPVELVSGNVMQFGYAPEEFLSGSITYSSIIHPDDLERVTREVHDFCNEGAGQFRLEYRIMTKEGDIRWVNEHTNVERDAAGDAKNFEGIVIDVTERKLAEDSIRESRAKYQAIVDSFDGLIYISSQDYRIGFMNRKLIERTGRDAVGEYCYKVMHDRDSVCPWCLNKRVFAGETVRREMFSPRDERWYYVINVPIGQADGSTWKHSMMVDITDRKLFEEELQRQKKQLEELNLTLEQRVREEVANNREKDVMLIQQNRQAALGEMLDHIAHQWKQPLTSISLIIQDLGETASDGELTDEHVEETVSKTMALLDHMGQTIDIFRGFYRPDKEKKVFSIKDCIDQAIAFVAPAFRFQSVAVELDADPGLTAFGYPKEYTQVLLNILANTKDVFRKRGTEKPRVTIRAFAEDSKTVVTITDNAGGIPEAIIDKIFDFYFTTNESGGGTGIGLYMSKNIIENNMGGTLSAKNTDGGAQFRIEIFPT